jgi:hypothetical protein
VIRGHGASSIGDVEENLTVDEIVDNTYDKVVIVLMV